MARILVTGASSGLGLATVMSLAADGHDVVAHARNGDRVDGSGVRQHAHEVILGDLSQLDETIGVAEQANALGRFDAVIHNAGTTSVDTALAVNTLAPYVLAALMLRPDRMIVVSSSMHAGGSAELNPVVHHDGVASYSDSKFLVTALVMALARRWSDMMAHAVDPGWVPTRMGGPSAPDDLDEGHRTQIWLATAPPSQIVSRTGGYWYHRATRQPHATTNDATFQDRLIDALHDRTGIALPA